MGAGGVILRSDSDGVNFDAATWNLYPSPTTQDLYSLHQIDDYLFVGA